MPLPTIDTAFPPAIHVAGPTKHVAISPGEVTWVTVDVANDRYQHERDLILDVPVGIHVVGMAVDDAGGGAWASQQSQWSAAGDLFDGETPARVETTGSSGVDAGGRELWASLRPRWSAARDFFHGETPTLVEAAGSSGGVDHFRIRISDGGRYAFALCSACDGVDDDTSLFIETNRPKRGVITDIGPRVAHAPADLDHAIIQRAMQFHTPQLRRCWMEVAQRDRVEGDVDLAFEIQQDGTTANVAISSQAQLAGARACLASVVAAITFPASESSVEIHYPITFKLDR